ncbi:MAG: spermidine/putrescine transport system ATP-binding protein [Saprospiraceae bacterium]|jgi:spermidine/putrescine transport system ATP-binding protein
MSDNAINICGVSKIYGAGAGAVTALERIDLDIQDQEFFTLLGPSGCGKTTLLRLIGGFEQPNTGEILLFGNHLEGLEPNERQVNTVFQHYSLFPHMSITENIGFGLKMLGQDDATVSARVAKMLELVKMEEFAQRTPKQLSGGQQQRIALARALAPNPKVLLLDEPLSALDLKLRQAMRQELKQLQKETGITFVFVTHDQEEAMSMSDRIAVMSQGKLQQLAAPEALYENPKNQFVANFIGDVNLIEATVGEQSDGLITCSNASLSLKANSDSEQTLGDTVTVAIRPEKLRFTSSDNADIKGAVTESMYIGTDQLLTVKLLDESTVDVRFQNIDITQKAPSIGENVGLQVADGTAWILGE